MPTNWAGNHTYRAARWHEPTSVDELVDLVGRVERLRVVASRHCFNDIGDTDGDLVSLRALPVECQVDGDRRVVRVSAWMLYAELGERLHAAGWALPNLASLPHISVGGAVATGTHGSGDGCGNLASAVVGLDVIDADGSSRTVRRGDPGFEAQVVALGATGVWTHVHLALEPTYDVAQRVLTDLPWDVALEDLGAVTGAAYSVSLFTDFTGDSIGQVWLKARVAEGTSPDELPDELPDALLRARAATEPVHMLVGADPSACTQQLGVPGAWHLRLPHFRPEFTPSRGLELQSEYLVPRTHAVTALERMRGLGDLIAPLVQVAEVRTVAADDLWLSGAYDADVVCLHVTWVQDEPAVRAVLDPVEAALLPLGARPHWGKVFNADASALAGVHPRLADFRALRDELDPDQVFGNDYLDRVLG